MHDLSTQSMFFNPNDITDVRYTAKHVNVYNTCTNSHEYVYNILTHHFIVYNRWHIGHRYFTHVGKVKNIMDKSAGLTVRVRTCIDVYKKS
jgi:hypothetical protein